MEYDCQTSQEVSIECRYFIPSGPHCSCNACPPLIALTSWQDSSYHLACGDLILTGMKELMVALLMFGPLVPARFAIHGVWSVCHQIPRFARDYLVWEELELNIFECEWIRQWCRIILDHEQKSETIVAQIVKFRTNSISRCLLDFHKWSNGLWIIACFEVDRLTFLTLRGSAQLWPKYHGICHSCQQVWGMLWSSSDVFILLVELL